jgi:hypothetical protein
MVMDPMVSIFDNKFDSLNTSCGKVSDEMSFSKSVLGTNRVIYIINREGKRLNTIKVGKGYMYSLYCGKDTTLYCCDTDYFRRLFAKGNTIWSIQSILLLQHDTFVFPVWCKAVNIV